MNPNPSMPNEPNAGPTAPKSDRFKTVVAWVCGPIVVFAVAFALADAAGVRLSRTPPEKNYASSARLLVGGTRVIPKLKNGDPVPDAFYATSVEILQSRDVIKRAHDRALHSDRSIIIQPQPCQVEASRLPGTNIIVVRATAKEPNYVQTYLDALIDEFLETRQWLSQWISKDGTSDILRSLLKIDSVLGEQVAELDAKIKDMEQGKYIHFGLENLKASRTRMRELCNLVNYRSDMFFPHSYEVFKILERASPAVELKPPFSMWNILR